ncbi:MAG: hypothetical protein EYR95_18980 [Phormidium sp. SL48-SHIP]|nr:MAG: hypothetical protein EYR95_18980 [Phormidium sp. SL48-SHIP]
MTKTLNQLTEITTLADDDLLLARDVSAVEDKRITVANLQAGSAKLSGGADANFTAMPQVGGDPIVERGSNANGEYVKFADGTMWCSRQVVFDGSDSSTQVYDSPAEFYDPIGNFIPSSVSGGEVGSASFIAAGNVGVKALGGSSSQFQLRDPSTSAGQSVALLVSAIGRWY